MTTESQSFRDLELRFHPEPTHELIADPRRIALRRVGRLARINSAPDQPRTILTQRDVDHFFQRAFIRGPGALGDAGAARDGDNIGAQLGSCLLAAGDLVGAVIENNDRQNSSVPDAQLSSNIQAASGSIRHPPAQ